MEYKPQWMNMPNLSLRNQFVLLVLVGINILPHLASDNSIIQEKAGEREDELTYPEAALAYLQKRNRGSCSSYQKLVP